MRRSPSPRGWRRRAVGAVTLLMAVPVLPSMLVVVLVTGGLVLSAVLHVVASFWPLLVVAMVVVTGRYLLRVFYRRRW